MRTGSGSVVFVAQEVRDKNLLPAEEYGALVAVLPPEQVTSMSIERLMEKAEAHMREYDPSRDYILAVGDPIAIALTAMIAGRDGCPVKFLKWDRAAQRYHVVEVDPIKFEEEKVKNG